MILFAELEWFAISVCDKLSGSEALAVSEATDLGILRATRFD